MKSREILLVVLVVAIALGSGLIGLYLGRSSVQQAAAPGTTAPVEGQTVSVAANRLFSEAGKQNLAYEIQADGRVYPGPSQSTDAILFFDGQSIYRGASATGEKLFTVEGNSIFVGASTTGPRAYTVENGKIYEGSTTGPVLYNIAGDKLYQGASTTGDLVFQANQPLTGDVQFLLPILAEERF